MGGDDYGLPCQFSNAEGTDQWDNAHVEFAGFPDYLDAMHKALDNVVVMEEPADGVGEYLTTCNTMAEYQVFSGN